MSATQAAALFSLHARPFHDLMRRLGEEAELVCCLVALVQVSSTTHKLTNCTVIRLILVFCTGAGAVKSRGTGNQDLEIPAVIAGAGTLQPGVPWERDCTIWVLSRALRVRRIFLPDPTRKFRSFTRPDPTLSLIHI